MRFRELEGKEKEKVTGFFSEKYGISRPFWDTVVLLKRVNSVWLCSKEAAALANDFHAETAGLLILLELKTLKESRQATDFFSSYRF